MLTTTKMRLLQQQQKQLSQDLFVYLLYTVQHSKQFVLFIFGWKIDLPASGVDFG
jgi:hypothetical protein